MNCPKCGLQAAPEQKFCRSCGESLQMITQRLDKSTSVSPLESQASIYSPEKTDRTNPFLAGGFLILFLGAAIGVIGKKLMHNELITVIGVLGALAGMFISVFPYIVLPPRSKHRGGLSSESELRGQSELQKSLPLERTTEYMPGITERTTDLLTNSVATREPVDSEKSHE